MESTESHRGTVMRLFQAKTRQGGAAELIEKLATTSADVVQHEPGNIGYFFGRGLALDEETIVFASFWKDLEAVKQRFGEKWQRSFLPEGYEDLILECSVQHIDVGSGWHVRLNES